MDKFSQLFEEFILKAIEQTEAAINFDFEEGQKLEAFTANRDRLFLVIEQISKQVDWLTVTDEKREELTRQVEYIKKLDEKLLVKLQEYRESLKSEIEKTHRQTENIKGYNLSDVK
ncbi:MAG TPA: hypothetical protein VNJ08_03415 [Bacteriovoracaceae bacterium]|nr:hypothetical protein [Bacteriovoracaceae bacterium]